MPEDWKDELRHYLPGKDRARELSDPKGAEERLARAMESPSLQAALGEETPATPPPVPPAATKVDDDAGAHVTPVPPEPPQTTAKPAELERPSRPLKPMTILLVSLSIALPTITAWTLRGRLEQLASPAASTSGERDSDPPGMRAGTGVQLPTASPSAGAGPNIEASAPLMASAPPTGATGAASATGLPAGTGAAPNATGAAPKSSGTPKPTAPAIKIRNGPSLAPSTAPTAPPGPTGSAPRYTDPDF